jgi:hypothetical protein
MNIVQGGNSGTTPDKWKKGHTLDYKRGEGRIFNV